MMWRYGGLILDHDAMPKNNNKYVTPTTGALSERKVTTDSVKEETYCSSCTRAPVVGRSECTYLLNMAGRDECDNPFKSASRQRRSGNPLKSIPNSSV